MSRSRSGDLGSRHRSPQDSAGLVLWQVAASWQQRIRAVLTPLGLTHAQFVLLASAAWLAREQEGATQAQIAALAHADPVMTSEVLRTLEKRGLLDRRPHPEDGRARRVLLTDSGRRLVRRAVPLVEAEDTAFFQARGAELVGLATVLAHFGIRPRKGHRSTTSGDQ
jgi:MarR family transcriptional regulator, organic hydroperoxide resistance regulator